MHSETDNSVQDEPEAQTAAPAYKEPSPLDRALQATRPSYVQAGGPSLWLDGSHQVAIPPMAFDPGNINKHATYSDDNAASVEPAVQALAAMQAATQAVIQVRQAAQSDPTLTEAAAVLTVADAADKLLPQATKCMDAALRNVEAQIAAAQQALAAPVTQGANLPQSAELRAVVRAMEPGERLALIQAAIRDGDAALAGAVLGGHPLLSGLDAKGIQALTAQWHRARNPQAVQKLALLEHSAASLIKAGQQYIAQMEALQGSSMSTVQRLRTATGKARAVLGGLIPQAA